jgi:hypothetical protein
LLGVLDLAAWQELALRAAIGIPRLVVGECALAEEWRAGVGIGQREERLDARILKRNDVLGRAVRGFAGHLVRPPIAAEAERWGVIGPMGRRPGD